VKNAIFLRSFLQLLVIDNVPSSLILSTPMMEAIPSSKTSVLTRATLHRIPEDGIPLNLMELGPSWEMAGHGITC
jgi:hypothetical protein